MATRITPIATRQPGDRVVDGGVLASGGTLQLVAAVTATDMVGMIRNAALRVLLIAQIAPVADPTNFSTRVSGIFDGRREANAQDDASVGETAVTALADQLEAQGGAADDVAALRLHAPLQRHATASAIAVGLTATVDAGDRVRAGYRVVTGTADLGLQIDFTVT